MLYELGGDGYLIEYTADLATVLDIKLIPRGAYDMPVGAQLCSLAFNHDGNPLVSGVFMPEPGKIRGELAIIGVTTFQTPDHFFDGSEPRIQCPIVEFDHGVADEDNYLWLNRFPDSWLAAWYGTLDEFTLGQSTGIQLGAEGGVPERVTDISVFSGYVVASSVYGADGDPNQTGLIKLFAEEILLDSAWVDAAEAVALPHTIEAYQTGGLRLFAGGHDDVSGAELFTIAGSN